MKLFQIEEPEGGPSDPDMPGMAIGIDASGTLAEVAVSVGGNAAVLDDREGLEMPLPVPPQDAGSEAWHELLAGGRIRAERALARPVTHGVLVIVAAPDEAFALQLHEAAALAGIDLLRVVTAAELGEPLSLAAATLAEDLAPRPGFA